MKSIPLKDSWTAFRKSIVEKRNCITMNLALKLFVFSNFENITKFAINFHVSNKSIHLKKIIFTRLALFFRLVPNRFLSIKVKRNFIARKKNIRSPDNKNLKFRNLDTIECIEQRKKHDTVKIYSRGKERRKTKKGWKKGLKNRDSLPYRAIKLDNEYSLADFKDFKFQINDSEILDSIAGFIRLIPGKPQDLSIYGTRSFLENW